ncbi:hypothetical protein [Halorubrum cibi]|uniref:Uncharacterized protein n=1 Tax=Halorubrum cibi TaxID=413815 RepID=A0A521EAA7_9EURY|nr:hypothetical protein [Halorubrum cibi]SMO80100.1 hypothetical protein SAMN06264867_109144 [Halorubrum cibi]
MARPLELDADRFVRLVLIGATTHSFAKEDDGIELTTCESGFVRSEELVFDIVAPAVEFEAPVYIVVKPELLVDGSTERQELYGNGMVASHLAALEAAVGERVVEWSTPTELDRAVDRIP